MKTKLHIIYMVVAASVVLALAISVWRNVSLRREAGRLKADLETEISGRTDEQQVLTKAELREYFDGYVKELKEYGVRTGSVENIVNIEYRIRDTTIVREKVITVYDTVRRNYRQEFDVRTECYRIAGDVCDSVVTIREHDLSDDILVTLYRERRKCLFDRRKVKAIAISQCKGDTLKILRNLRIQKRDGR